MVASTLALWIFSASSSAIEGFTLNSNVHPSLFDSPLTLRVAISRMGSQQPGFPEAMSTSPTDVKSMFVLTTR